jgi:AcrR family transcriptional regulator
MADGLRERKKQATRHLLADTARRLFQERGFEAVTVAEIAQAADVSEKTVFNYFPTKEDLFYSQLESFEDELLAAITHRAAGVTVINAFARFLRGPRGVFAITEADGDAAATDQLHAITRLITSSPALLARERQVFDRYTESLAAALAAEAGLADDAVEPHATAAALLGVHRALIAYVRRRALAGDTAAAIAPDLERETETALARLEDGLRDYLPKRG